MEPSQSEEKLNRVKRSENMKVLFVLLSRDVVHVLSIDRSQRSIVEFIKVQEVVLYFDSIK